ncbi:hypothetical protein OROGR_019286 [Orobanche gracilis]
MPMFHDENRLMKFQGKRVQEGVGDKKVRGKRVQEGVGDKKIRGGVAFPEPSAGQYDFSKEPLPTDFSIYPSFLLDSYTGCGGECHTFERDWGVVDETLTLIPGMRVPPCLFDFAKEMFANSDDKTVLATNLARATKSDSDLLELFKPIGDVRRARLAIDKETGISGRFGFVTFVTKKDAQKAIEELNGHVYG